VPTYEYRCDNCGELTEAVQSFTDPALTQCPQCHAEALRKVFGNVGVVFKGSGFYRNDARAEAKSKRGGPGKPGGDTGADRDKAASSDKAGGGDKAAAGDKTAGGDKAAGTGSGSSGTKSGDTKAAPKPAAGGGTAKG
jgi:putative FmdB family regulatory protein